MNLQFFLFHVYVYLIKFYKTFWLIINDLTKILYPVEIDDFVEEKNLYIDKFFLTFKNIDLNKSRKFDLIVPCISLNSIYDVEIFIKDKKFNFLVINDKENSKLYGLSPRKTHIFGLPKMPHDVGAESICVKLISKIDGHLIEKNFNSDEEITFDF